jgi:hypothetical protein
MTTKNRGEANCNAKMNTESVLWLRRMRPWFTLVELGRLFGISKATVSQIARHQLWRHVGEPEHP